MQNASTTLVVVAFIGGCGTGADESPDAGAPDFAVGSEADMATVMDMSRPRVPCNLQDEDGGINGCAEIRGQVNGYYVGTVRSVFAVVTDSSFNVYISDRPDLCSVLQAGASPKVTSFFRVGSTADQPQPFPAGVYTYPSGPGSGGGTGHGPADPGDMGTRNAVIASSDDNCIFEGYNQAAEGSFLVDAPVDTHTTVLTGNFDVLFEVGLISGEIEGSFVAPVCPNATDITFVAPMYCQ